jgi:signal transduction histidine kinase
MVPHHNKAARPTCAAVADDRDRVARRLNDDVISGLFSIGLRLQAVTELVEGTARARIELAISDLDVAIAQVRNVIFDRAEPCDPNCESH